jgi:hypothetical protein
VRTERNMSMEVEQSRKMLVLVGGLGAGKMTLIGQHDTHAGGKRLIEWRQHQRSCTGPCGYGYRTSRWRQSAAEAARGCLYFLLEYLVKVLKEGMSGAAGASDKPLIIRKQDSPFCNG